MNTITNEAAMPGLPLEPVTMPETITPVVVQTPDETGANDPQVQ